MLKNNWEKTSQKITIDEEIISSMISQAFPSKKLIDYRILLGGCANLNIKINLPHETYILRIYIRDKDAAYKEQKLSNLIKDSVPIPTVYHIGNYNHYCFAIVEYAKGITLRELIISYPNVDISQVMFEIGSIFAKFKNFEWLSSGIFDSNLNPIKYTYQDIILKLNGSFIYSELGKANIDKINFYFKKCKSFLPQDNEKQLVHGNFDPSNILVDRIDGQWKVSAIIDWEFAFAGSMLWDIANMLRYSHKIDLKFKYYFLDGLKKNDLILPQNFEISLCLLNLLSLIELLDNSSKNTEPNRINDIIELINYNIKKLDYSGDSLLSIPS